MKQLAIDWDDLSLAFDSSFGEISYYLDTETGQVLTVTDESRRKLEQIIEEYDNPGNPDAFDIEQALARADLRDWQKADVKTADYVETHLGSRVIAIADTLTYEAYDEMFVGNGDGRGGFDAPRDVRAQVRGTLPEFWSQRRSLSGG
jgi:hypothetical protein